MLHVLANLRRANLAGRLTRVPYASSTEIEYKLTCPPSRIRLETKLAAHPTLEGTLFTACPITNLVAISIPSTPPTHHVLPISSINNFTLLSTASSPGPPSFTSASPPIAPVDPVALAKRADAAVARLKEAAARKNKSVSKEAQDLFDALIRTLPTRWDGTNIVVNDAVVITAPYRVEDCRLGAGQQAGMLARVKKVVSVPFENVARQKY